MENSETQKCTNCERDFPIEKIDLHEAYCRRNVRKCQQCGQFVDKNEQEDHNEQFHSKQKCQYCQKEIDPKIVANHNKTCPQRPKECKFCEVEIPAPQFEQHQYTCGSRTKPCLLCKQYILFRDYDKHEKTCVGPQKYEPAKSTIKDQGYKEPLQNSRAMQNAGKMILQNNSFKQEESKYTPSDILSSQQSSYSNRINQAKIEEKHPPRKYPTNDFSNSYNQNTPNYTSKMQSKPPQNKPKQNIVEHPSSGPSYKRPPSQSKLSSTKNNTQSYASKQQKPSQQNFSQSRMDLEFAKSEQERLDRELAMNYQSKTPHMSSEQMARNLQEQFDRENTRTNTHSNQQQHNQTHFPQQQNEDFFQDDSWQTRNSFYNSPMDQSMLLDDPEIQKAIQESLHAKNYVVPRQRTGMADSMYNNDDFKEVIARSLREK